MYNVNIPCTIYIYWEKVSLYALPFKRYLDIWVFNKTKNFKIHILLHIARYNLIIKIKITMIETEKIITAIMATA